MRKKILLANWKLNADYFSIKKYLSNIHIVEDIDIYVAPSYMGILPTFNLINNKNINIVSQNVSSAISGDHTGSISYLELKDYGINSSIIGHPEAIKDFSENINEINLKLKRLLENNFKIFLCINESRTDLLKDSSKENLKRQIRFLLKDIDPLLFIEKLVLVYKPTFNSELSERANPQFVIDTIKIIRSFLREEYNYFVGNNLPIIYGGDYLSEDIMEIISSNYLDGIMLDDNKAISSKYNSLILKALLKSSTEEYKNFFENNVLIKEPLELDREKAKDTLTSFNEYEIDNDLYFKEIDLTEEDI